MYPITNIQILENESEHYWVVVQEWAKSNLQSVLVNKSCIGMQPHLFLSCIVYGGFYTETAELIVVTESIWLAKPKKFTISPFKEKVW